MGPSLPRLETKGRTQHHRRAEVKLCQPIRPDYSLRKAMLGGRSLPGIK